MIRSIAFLASFFILSGLYAQVEVFRPSSDTATYIDPKDTITTPPIFETGDLDFFRYIETHFTMLTTSTSLTYTGGNYKFKFYIDKDGSLSDFEMITFSDANISRELERVISLMPKWTPGVFEGKKKRTLMVYDINIQRVNDFNSIQVTKRDSDVQYTRQTNSIKWFIVAGSVLILLGLFITRS